MQLKNYQEEIVRAVIPLALEEHPELRTDEAFLHDVAAYVLNRLPPRYIMSERGLTRIAAENWLLDPDEEPRRKRDPRDPALVGMVQVLLLVNRAIQVVGSRRRAPSPEKRQSARRSRRGEIDLGEGFWHNFPQIIGRVVDSRGGSPLPGVSVSMSSRRLGQLESEPGWSNPCATNEATRGYFSLWPRALRDEASVRTFTLSFSFEHPEYETATREYRFRSRGSIISDGELRLDRVINLGSQAMKRRGASRS